MATQKPEDPPPARHPPAGPAGAARFGIPKIIGGTVLLAFLTVIGTYVFGGFDGLSAGGVMALILGVTFSYALGVGLMVAVFYSSRFYDDSAHEAALDHFSDRRKES
ncbi:MAG: hypothetical protein AB7S92_14920 [Parvibaculaceae bacterium]